MGIGYQPMAAGYRPSQLEQAVQTPYRARNGVLRHAAMGVASGLLGVVLAAMPSRAVEQQKVIIINGMSECQDGIDNDGDSGADYLTSADEPNDDDQCASNADNSEGQGTGFSYNNRTFLGRSGERCGYALTLGDFNGDGILDTAMGCENFVYGFAGVGSDSEGSTHVVHDTNDSTQYLFRLAIPFGTENAYSLAAADLNANGNADLIVGNPLEAPDPDGGGARNLAGAVRTIDGAVLSGDKDYAEIDSGSTAYIAPEYKRTIWGDTRYIAGQIFATGDINQDSIADLVIGARTAEGPSTRTQSGKAIRVSGDSDTDGMGADGDFFTLTDLDLRTLPMDGSVTEFIGAAAGDRFGFGIAIGDWDGDANQNLAIGATETDGGRGSVYDFESRPSWPQVYDLSTTAADHEVRGRIVTGPDSVDYPDHLGHPLVFAKMKSTADRVLLAGSELGARSDRRQPGKTYAIEYLQLPDSGYLNLDTTAPWIEFYGGAEQQKVAHRAGDRSGDGLEDVIFGPGQFRTWFSRENPPSTVDISQPQDELIVPVGVAALGAVPAVGHLNSDNYVDIVVSMNNGAVANLTSVVGKALVTIPSTDCGTELDLYDSMGNEGSDGTMDTFVACSDHIPPSQSVTGYDCLVTHDFINTARSYCNQPPDAYNPMAAEADRYRRLLDTYPDFQPEDGLTVYIYVERQNGQKASFAAGSDGQRRQATTPECP